MSLAFASTPFDPRQIPDLRPVAERRVGPVPAELRPAFLAHGVAVNRLEQLFTGDALCVTTGQQPGLFTGPLFAVYKALSAVALATALEQTLRRAVVPVFWVGGDDHDFAESNHIYYLDAENHVERLGLPERPTHEASLPLFREILGPEISACIAKIAAGAPETEFRSAVLEWLTQTYRPERDFAAAFAEAMAQLLGAHGLVVFSPTTVAAKRAMAPVLLRTLELATELDSALADRAQELNRAGQLAPVPVGDGAVTVMVEGALGRDRLLVDGSHFVSRRSGEPWTLEDLAAVAADDPQRLSPNVLLRPVTEAALLPTVAYVAGPGELRYLPQAQPLYDRLGIAPQVPIPRWSGRILETRVTKVLNKYALSAEDLDAPEGQLEARLVRGSMPDEATKALAEVRRAIAMHYPRLQDAAAAVDPTLTKSVQSAQNAAFSNLSDLEKRIVAHLKKQNDIVIQQIAKARNNLYPLGRPQERMFNVAAYLIRYGPSFLEQVLDVIAAGYRDLDAGGRGS